MADQVCKEVPEGYTGPCTASNNIICRTNEVFLHRQVSTETGEDGVNVCRHAIWVCNQDTEVNASWSSVHG